MDEREMRSNASFDLTNMGDAVEYMPGFNRADSGGNGNGKAAAGGGGGGGSGVEGSGGSITRRSVGEGSPRGVNTVPRQSSISRHAPQ